MERVLDDLEQIHFSMKKANQVLRDMTRGIATDRHTLLFYDVLMLWRTYKCTGTCLLEIKQTSACSPALLSSPCRCSSRACGSNWPVREQPSTTRRP